MVNKADINQTLQEGSGGLSRRTLLQTAGTVGGAVALSTLLPRPLTAQLATSRAEVVPPVTDPSVRQLVMQGVQAAQDAGAQYAEVRLSNSFRRNIGSASLNDHQSLHAGVRVLVDGAWGFASGPFWSNDEIVKVARRAVVQARESVGAISGSAVDMSVFTKANAVKDGHWTMPVKYDPLSLHPYSIQDYLNGLTTQIAHEFKKGQGEQIRASSEASFFVQERAFGSSTDSYFTQKVYLTSGKLSVVLQRQASGKPPAAGSREIDLVTPSGAGWELFSEQPLLDAAFSALDDIKADMDLPVNPVSTGKFDTILDAVSVARLLSQTIGSASQLDRALGYEADSTGISYLNNPANMLGKLKVGSSLLSVTANRTEQGGAATIKWDDEGVASQPFTLVKQGVFQDYHTTREGASWLNDEKVKGKRNIHGVANAPTAAYEPLAHTANLTLEPNSKDITYDDLISSVKSGLVMEQCSPSISSNLLNGMLRGRVYEVKDGKKVARIANAGIMIRTNGFWNSLTSKGGQKSALRTGLASAKGDPQRQSYHSVTAVPAVFENQSVTDLRLR